ncbi:MAG TPA: hypothetical protein VFT22_45085 [Kofleriaceae bacterium]|nr:hypothetical protein [Kofleriaceae bacterium]
MKRLRVVGLIGALVALPVGLGCSGKPPQEPAGGAAGAGAAGGARATSAACEAVRPRVEQLYRAEAQAREPARVDEAVADNTTMVMNDCVKAPDKVAACVRSVPSAKELDARCLIPIDDEGTEGERRGR